MMATKLNSELFLKVSQRVEELIDAYLPVAPDGIGDYGSRARDDARACVVLVHAEFESYFEKLSVDLAKSRVSSIEDGSFGLPEALFLYEAGRLSQDKKLSHSKMIDAAKALESLHKREVVHSNHGIKTRNIEKLFRPFGPIGDFFDTGLGPMLDAFGANRGECAHEGATFGIKKEINPFETRKEILDLLKALKQFDERYASEL